jgi:DNA-3-methyladenine glycosylase
MILKRKFYQQKTLKVAQDLLGCFLVRKINGKIIRGIITETEAYIGEDDLACHASKGRTPRTETMYGEAGLAYVYMIYGMYFMLNVVTEKPDFPAAVLIRGIKILGSSTSKSKAMTFPELDGPGKLTKYLQIDKSLNGYFLIKGKKLWIEQNPGIKDFKIKKAKRIGVDYARHCKDYLWRFSIITE